MVASSFLLKPICTTRVRLKCCNSTLFTGVCNTCLKIVIFEKQNSKTRKTSSWGIFRCAKNRGCPLRSAQHSCLVAARLADKRPPLQATHLPNPESLQTTREPVPHAHPYLQNPKPQHRDKAIDVHVARSPRLRGFAGRSRAGRPWPLAANSVSRQRHGRYHQRWHAYCLVLRD